ncbi:biotin--[acetyl-CoA-carboxylase] ligase [Gordonia spumicola]|uniref:biotin--[biotin carboxyl-carrier protein] ligase n=1 Tax=Gordonia spumicola TaxID=589161 RepID=A0A7I9V9H0_9ACTN|nr:biotin--[acetyl-CoA-carboxylase] ligase [Gordonia spumicola]GEE02046.1 biotin--[acetyl-CoA-carboxylase] ligase [Gordonia spumicola]
MIVTDLPDVNALRDRLSDTRWRRIDVVPETGSTNADLISRADADADLDGSVRISGFQSQGRGRHARVWKTPHGQLAMSAAVAVTASDTDRIGWLSLLTGLAVRDALREVTGVDVELKWPNDVLAPTVDGEPGGKLSGILCEFRPNSDGGGVAVIGTGVNLDVDRRVTDGADAASVRGIGGAGASATDVAVAYLRALSARLADWPAHVDRLVGDYRAASATLGRRVRLILPGDVEVIGEAVDIDDQGRVIVDGPTGRTVASAGDVTHLRPI